MTKLSKELLENMYVKKNLTSEEIGRLLDCSDTKVLYWIRNYNIPIKPSSPIKKHNLTEQLLIELYVEKKFSCPEIGKTLNISSETIRYWLRKFSIKRRTQSEIRTKYTKLPFSGDLREKAYVLGLRTGDISARINHNMVRIYTATSHVSQFKMFKEVFEKYTHVHNYIDKHNGMNEWNLYCDLDKSFSFILKKPTFLPKWIFEDNEYFYSFLTGYMDCEGGWDIRKTNKDNIRFSFRLRTADKRILLRVMEKLKEFGYNPLFYMERKKGTKTNVGKYNKDFWCLALQSKKEAVSLASILLNYSHHNEKIRRMKLMLEIKDEINWSKVSDKVLKLRFQIKEEHITNLIGLDLNDWIGRNDRKVTQSESEKSFYTIP